MAAVVLPLLLRREALVVPVGRAIATASAIGSGVTHAPVHARVSLRACAVRYRSGARHVAAPTGLLRRQVLRPSIAAIRRTFFSAAGTEDEQPRYTQWQFSQEDHARFSKEKDVFRKEPRLHPSSFPAVPSDNADLDWGAKFRGATSLVFRVGGAGAFMEPFYDLCMERLRENASLHRHLAIPKFEDKTIEQAMHSKAVPAEGAYFNLRKQAYWLAIHVWLLHSKQHLVQKGEGVFGSALCALLTRKIFEFQWDRLRMFMHAADVPIMSISSELEDLQQYIFGFCVALDEAFEKEAPQGTLQALAQTQLHNDDNIGVAPRLKHVLWANVHSGDVPHDADYLHELTVYVLRQRIAFEALPPNLFLSGHVSWAQMPMP